VFLLSAGLLQRIFGEFYAKHLEFGHFAARSMIIESRDKVLEV